MTFNLLTSCRGIPPDIFINYMQDYPGRLLPFPRGDTDWNPSKIERFLLLFDLLVHFRNNLMPIFYLLIICPSHLKSILFYDYKITIL